MEPMKRHLICWGPVIVWMVVIFLFSSSSDPFWALPSDWKTPRVETIASQKVVADPVPLVEKIGRNGHVLEYAILGLLAYRAFRISGAHKPVLFLIAAAVLLATLYGLSDEFHQLFIPERDFDLNDLGLDVIGAMIGTVIGVWLFRKPARPE